MTPSAPAGARRLPSRRRPRLRWVMLALFLVVVGLGLLALPLLKVPSEASAAKEDLTTTLAALQSGDVRQAREAVAAAREHADTAQDAAEGVGGDVWSRIPLLGTPVDDARHLVAALRDATSVMEVGVDLYPDVAGRKATLFTGDRIDEATLRRVLAGMADAGDRLRSARDELQEVSASTPVVGDVIAANRDAAAAQVVPAADAYDRAEPLLDQLPSVFGFEGEQSYLIAMLNPAELRYSGGAALSYASMAWDEGRVELGAPLSPADDPRFQRRLSWRKVQGNDLHARNTFIANSTFAPSWSVSGAELLRAWRRGGGGDSDGVIAVDVVTLGRLLGPTGPLQLPGGGKVTGDTLVTTLVGSYDAYYPDATAQDAVNDALIPGFQAALFGGGNYLEKLRVLGESASGRHFATYFRDPAVQDGMAEAGLTGDLADTPGDYLFVGTQNTNGSKVDFYQRRDTSLDVRLDADGTATNRLDLTLDNDTPPYVDPAGIDPRTGYFTRWAGMRLGVFLPASAEVTSAELQGSDTEVNLRPHYQHRFFAKELTLEPGARGTLALDYQVPDAAAPDGDGGLVYRLAVDPQGMVTPSSATITVHLPTGFSAGSLPEGWVAEGRTLTFRTDALDSSEAWQIELSPDN